MKRSSYTHSVAAALLSLVVLALGGCKLGRGPQPGDLAPDFVAPRLDGSVQKLSNYRGSVVLLNLWATWCPPCIAEMPVLNRLAEKYGPRGVVVLGVAGDDDPEAVRRFVDQRGVKFEVLLDPGGAVGTQYGITGYPETFLVDREGRLREKFIGPLPAVGDEPAPEITGALEALIGERERLAAGP
ncbi:MAG: TlpA family protein disulfide reductase [Deltaproteobacteria bacterium]|nr:MAG: TlpA family protein disulfide reductase [Deltaproteobacteria bacterium]